MAIVIKKIDGSVSVMTLLDDAAEASALAPEHLDTIVQAEIAQWPDDLRESVVSWRVMPDDAIPTDRTFRAAWSDTTPSASIDIDMDRCREVWKGRLRRARAPKLAELDVAVMRAIESGGDTSDLARKKQALRDVTKHPDIEAAKTPEELKAVWPEELK